MTQFNEAQHLAMLEEISACETHDMHSSLAELLACADALQGRA